MPNSQVNPVVNEAMLKQFARLASFRLHTGLEPLSPAYVVVVGLVPFAVDDCNRVKLSQ